jgi:hypothetical protein
VAVAFFGIRSAVVTSVAFVERGGSLKAGHATQRGCSTAEASGEALKDETSWRACLDLSVGSFRISYPNESRLRWLRCGRNAARLRSIWSGRKRNTVAGRVSLSRGMTVPTRGVPAPERVLVSIKSIEPSLRTAPGRAPQKEGFGWTAVELAVGAVVAFPFDEFVKQ